LVENIENTLHVLIENIHTASSIPIMNSTIIINMSIIIIIITIKLLDMAPTSTPSPSSSS
jgi:hypothetical protein